ncbi:MAG: VWA domain-containing protein [Kiritimatiellia bacterium]
MNFAWPLCFLLAIPLAGAAWRMLRRGRRAGVKFAPVARLPVRTAGWRARVANGAPWFFLLGAALLMVAAARPRTALSRGNRSVDAIAIAMTVDVSGSMEALDLTPKGANYITRLDVVKELFRKFIEARPDDLIGLVTFGGYASSRVPLTADHEALLHVLKGVEVPSVSYDANGRQVDPDETLTAVGDGLATALARLKDAEPKSKIVILLSDGVSNTGVVEPSQAAAAAEKLGIRVYTIGVGTNSRRTPFRARGMFGRTQISYAAIPFDESQLKSIAEKTHARYFSVRDAEGLKAALEEIDSLEKTPLDRTVYQRWDEHFAPFLLGGMVLVLLGVSLQMAASRRLV